MLQNSIVWMSLDWMSFQNLDGGYCRPGLPKKCQFMGEPKIGDDFPNGMWDFGTMHPHRPGKHKICDTGIYGDCYKWYEVEDGMTVRIKTKDPNFTKYERYEFLFAATNCKYSYQIDY